MPDARFDRSLKRNLDELARCILDITAMEGLESADTYHAIDFIHLSHWALFNDCFAHAMRVFDRHPDAASFWYLRRCNQAELDKTSAAVGIELAEIEALSLSLKLIRDKTHFHIDKKSVSDPKAVWEEAGVKMKDFARILRSTFEALNLVHRSRLGGDFWLPDYDGSDAREIAKFAESLRASQPKHDPLID
jgi:hypothetical protein